MGQRRRFEGGVAPPTVLLGKHAVPLTQSLGNESEAPWRWKVNSNLQILALEEMRRTFDQYASASDALDSKAKSLLSSSSLIIGLFSLLQLSFLNPLQNEKSCSCIYQMGVVAIMVGYIALVALCIKALRPREYKNAIATNWNDLNAYFLQKEEDEAYGILIGTYLTSIEANKNANLEKAKYVNNATWIFVALVVGLFFISFLPH